MKNEKKTEKIVKVSDVSVGEVVFGALFPPYAMVKLGVIAVQQKKVKKQREARENELSEMIKGKKSVKMEDLEKSEEKEDNSKEES